MPNPNKETSMLIDIQYVKPNKRAGTPDYLYIIWRDLVTQEKFLQSVKEPKMSIYFTKEKYRTHGYNKNYEKIENLEERVVPFKDIIFEIANDMGDAGKNFLSNVFQTRNYSMLKNLLTYQYVYGADYDITSWYRIQWLRSLDNNLPKKIHKGFLDIEVDGFEVPGWASPTDCPINAVTLIDDWNKDVFTFILTDREFKPKNTSHMSEKEKQDEHTRESMYRHMHEEQHYMMNHQDELKDELHEMFDESYGELNYRLYFYQDERKMLIHLFQLINMLKLDFIGIWNISFDIPYIMDRLVALGLDPKEVMCHPDFPVKECYFKEDKIHHDIKNKNDTFHISGYTTFYDQMQLYAAIRKGQAELRSYKLNYIASEEIKDTKLDYSEDGDIKTLPYTNFKKFIIYNIKDVLLQYGIEKRTGDFDELYMSSYLNATNYAKVFKQTVVLRNVQYLSFLSQGLIPGENINIFNTEDENTVSSEDEEDEDEDSYEGALVADPQYNGYVGQELYGKKTNNIFNNGIDFDMTAFYPSSIFAMNIDPSTLIFKTIMPMKQYIPYGGEIPFNGITKDYFYKSDDGAKECLDNFQTGNYMSTAHKWMNMPSIDKIYSKMKKELG